MTWRKRAIGFAVAVISAVWLVAAVNVLTIRARVEDSLSGALPAKVGPHTVRCRKLVEGFTWTCMVEQTGRAVPPIAYSLVIRGRCWVAVAPDRPDARARGVPLRVARCLSPLPPLAAIDWGPA